MHHNSSGSLLSNFTQYKDMSSSNFFFLFLHKKKKTNVVRKTGPHQVKKCLQTCIKCADSHHPAHAQCLTLASALHWNMHKVSLWHLLSTETCPLSLWRLLSTETCAKSHSDICSPLQHVQSHAGICSPLKHKQSLTLATALQWNIRKVSLWYLLSTEICIKSHSGICSPLKHAHSHSGICSPLKHVQSHTLASALHCTMRKISLWHLLSTETCTTSPSGICSSLKHSIMSNDSVYRQQRPWSDCTFVQSDQSLCCPH